MDSTNPDRRNKTPLDLPADHVRVLHAEARSGCVAVAQRVGEGRRWRERAIPLRDVGRYVSTLPPGLDTYLSQGRFAGRRRIASLVTIGSVWSDLDVHKDEEFARLSDDELLSRVLHRCEEERIAPPSYVVSSGQGLQASSEGLCVGLR